ncbi:indolepyruvate oxidoreductase subunit beta family protein [Roseivivax sediminis]|uniref:Indolepyruvate ferredoxin oxidoreductase beta subunit n=1 Tax=Roseivivax sediminis TaxID=936889 RepID=A0A1I1Z624_9RHOB|nr:indolepyruvate oxidoreductase subunit beta family protein [Roseivivax sediminis]SFE26738.1 indolepyruvate ferredoxin oxidoreductase beta subunit [Roseivivax sediminis]
MNQAVTLDAKSPDPRLGQVLKLAVMAVGGQGGGVLTNWIIDLAERNGYAAQATSVAGVAQRTGATIYYVEMLPESDRQPVFALAPAEGDVDILIAAEMMEAGRAIMRGFVTPDRTTLIASSHRALAVSEKIVPGTGLADSRAVAKAAEESAAKFVAFDMEAMARDAGSVISASLFGALAGSGTLPFPAETYRETIRASGRGVDASLAAFEAAREAAAAGRTPTTTELTEAAPEPGGVLPPAATPVHEDADPERMVGPDAMLSEWEALTDRAKALPEPVVPLAQAGLRKLVDYQDVAYGREYLDRLDAILARDRAAGGEAQGFDFTANAAKYLATAMAYDDIPRVADLKTRKGRFERINDEMRAPDGTLVHVTEYMHPRAEEAISVMPARLGAWVEARPHLVSALDRAINRGRRLRTDRLAGFAMLYVVAGLRKRRRGMLRHGREMAHIETWLDTALGRLDTDYAHATETLKIRRLIKGYSDTHARGLAKFDKVMSGATLVEGRDDAADWTARLITAALKAPQGEALDGALQTIRSFTTAGEA